MRAEAGGQAVRRSGDFGESPSRGDPIGIDTGPLPARSPTLWIRLRAALSACTAGFRRIAGMPDYEAYLRHLRRHHPDRPVPSEREFFTLYVESRYGNGPSRCC